MKNEKQNKIEGIVLAQKLKSLLREELVAIITAEDDVLTMQFPNGQRFSMRIEEN